MPRSNTRRVPVEVKVVFAGPGGPREDDTAKVPVKVEAPAVSASVGNWAKFEAASTVVSAKVKEASTMVALQGESAPPAFTEVDAATADVSGEVEETVPPQRSP